MVDYFVMGYKVLIGSRTYAWNLPN